MLVLPKLIAEDGEKLAIELNRHAFNYKLLRKKSYKDFYYKLLHKIK